VTETNTARIQRNPRPVQVQENPRETPSAPVTASQPATETNPARIQRNPRPDPVQANPRAILNPLMATIKVMLGTRATHPVEVIPPTK